MEKIVYALLAAGTGCFFALQATANSKFRANLASPAYAAFFSICGTIITGVFLMLVLRPTLPSMDDFKRTSWWNWIGGPLGAMIVLAGATLTKELGAAAFIALVVAGQLISSMILDHFALMGLDENPITFPRIIGALLVVAGVVCIKFL